VTALSFTIDTLARAQMRYSVTITDLGAVVIVNGKRAEDPLHTRQVEIEFDAAGDLLYMRGRSH
jgi:hypothetical protein